MIKLNKIKEQFHLEKQNPEYEKIERYKGTYNALYQKKPILISDEIIDEIINRVDKEQENIIGYNL